MPSSKRASALGSGWGAEEDQGREGKEGREMEEQPAARTKIPRSQRHDARRQRIFLSRVKTEPIL